MAANHLLAGGMGLATRRRARSDAPYRRISGFDGLWHLPNAVAATSKPVGATAKPVAAMFKPVAVAAKPVAATSKAVGVDFKPVAATAKPVGVDFKPVAATAKPVGVTFKAVAAGSKAVGATSKAVGLAEKSDRGRPHSQTLRAKGGWRHAERLGVRREAKRHAAFMRATRLEPSKTSRPPESGVAAALCHRSPKPRGSFKPVGPKP
jgi:hypothetical protein